MPKPLTQEQRKFISDKISELLESEENRKLSASKIVQILQERNPDTALAKLYPDHLRKHFVTPAKKALEQDYVFKIEEEDTTYEVENGNYVWNRKDGTRFTISVETVDEIFYEYAKKGKDWSQTRIRQNYDLTIPEWHSIKRRLQLYKESNIFSPWTVENTGREELASMIEEKLSRLDKGIQEVLEDKYKKKFVKDARKAHEELVKRKIFSEELIDTLSDLLPKKPRVVFKRAEIIKPTYVSISPVIADLHNGAWFRGSRNTKSYSREKAKEYLKETANTINAYNSPKVHLKILGDLMESVSGLNHKNTWQSMEFGYFGADLIFDTLKLIEWFIGQINNLTDIDAVTGNHDRMSSDKKEDPIGEAAKLIYKLIEDQAGDVLPVNYIRDNNEPVVRNYHEGWLSVSTHGHLGISNKKGADLLAAYGDSNVFTVFMQGHLHTFKVLECNSKWMKAILRSVFPGNFYSESLGFHGLPGFTVFENETEGVPNMKDITFDI